MKRLGIIQRHEVVDIGWKPPSKGWFKFNIDGASKGSEKAGCGELC